MFFCVGYLIFLGFRYFKIKLGVIIFVLVIVGSSELIWVIMVVVIIIWEVISEESWEG